jgi:hypothetical protein
VNQVQYDTAKDIILDLLGWGVLPEYLMDCGLSRHIIYYVFSELHLRLPENFDSTGILPPPQSLSSTPPRARRATMGLSSIPLPAHRPSGSPTSVSHSFPSHPSLPAKPPTYHPPDLPATPRVLLGTPSEPSANANSLVKTPVMQNTAPLQRTSTSTPVMTNLHDIEQQRRQELLARKAVIASRKAKQAAAAPPTPEGQRPGVKDQDVEMTPSVPTETVDDFLKSIEPTNDVDTPGPAADGTRLAGTRKPSSHSMDVDVLISGSVSPSDLTSPSAIGTTRSASCTDLPWPAQSSTSSTDGGSAPPTSASSGDSAIDSSTADSDSCHDISENLPRGTKRRAVASDFVDFEPSRATNGHDYPDDGLSSHSNHLMRRRIGSGFAGVSGMRRCVIDLSDSEDDGGRTITLDYGEGEHEGRLSPEPIRILQPSTPNGGSGYSTPPLSVHVNTIGASTSMTPASLVEKEQEIARMRELIKQREQVRRKKLATVRQVRCSFETCI